MNIRTDRRTLLKKMMTGLGAIVAAPALAEQCKNILTPAQTSGPFYPRTRVADQNADLVKVDGAAQEAKGQKVLILGKVVDENCQPVAGALVDMWQACATGRYNHPSDPNPAALDPNFQYSAQILTAADGTFRIRTIIPGAYPAADDWVRPPHIHFRFAKLGYRELVTQTYFDKFVELNQKDLILQDLDHDQQESIIVKMNQPGVGDDLVMGAVDFVGELVIGIEKARPKA